MNIASSSPATIRSIERPGEAWTACRSPGRQAEARQDQQRVDQRARALDVERDALAAQVGDRADAGILGHQEMHALQVEAGQRAQAGHRRLAGEDAGAGEGAVGHVALGEAGLDPAGGDRLDIDDRALRGLDHQDQVGHAAAAGLVAGARPRRPREQVGDQRAHRIVGAGDAAGGDLDVARFLRLQAAGRQTTGRERRAEDGAALPGHGPTRPLVRHGRTCAARPHRRRCARTPGSRLPARGPGARPAARRSRPPGSRS